jgi:hypothetical protein
MMARFEQKADGGDDKAACHATAILDMKRVPGGDFIVSTSDINGSIYFWKI